MNQNLPKVRKISIEYDENDRNSVVLEFLEPKYADLDINQFDYDVGDYGYTRWYDPEYILKWSGNGRMIRTRKPIDMDDNPCIVRGSE